MRKRPKPDVNQTASRVVSKSTAGSETPLPADIEAAWAAWVAGVGNVDERARALLRAAFEAGVEAARASHAVR